MILADEKIIKALFQELPKLPLESYTEREYRDLFIDQMGFAISYGGRSFTVFYVFSMFLAPKLVRATPSHLIRVPMAVVLYAYGESIYFYGSHLALRIQSARIINQMRSLPEGPLRELSISLSNK